MVTRNVICEVGTQFLNTSCMKFVPEGVQIIQNVAKLAVLSGQTWWTDLTSKECNLHIKAQVKFYGTIIPTCNFI